MKMLKFLLPNIIHYKPLKFLVMKNVKNVMFVLGLALLSLGVQAAVVPSAINPEGVQIQKMLTPLDLSSQVAKGTKINISFLVNAKNEIIVLSTNNNDFDSLIKNTLNYRKISMSELAYNTVYTLPVEFK